MATVSMQSVNWINSLKKSMPVKFTLKSDDPANGLTKENVEKAVRYGSEAYKGVKIPDDAYAAVFRDTDNGNKIGGLLHAKANTYVFDTNTKDEANGLYTVVDKIGTQLEVLA